MSPSHKASNLAAFLALMARLMTSSSVSSLWCSLALAGCLSMGSAKCMVWKVPSSSERSLITAHLYCMPGYGEEPLRTVDLDIAFPAVGDIASDYDVESGTGSGTLGVAVEVPDYLESPASYLPVLIYTVIQVDARVKVCA